MSSRQVKAYTFILFFISPLLGLFLGLQTLDKRGKHLILIVFGVFYGLLLNYAEGADAVRYIELVETYYTLGLLDFWERFIDIIKLQPSYDSPKDLYIHFLCGIAGSIFSSSSLLYAIVGAVYGYFYGWALLRVVNLTKRREKRIGILAFMLIFLFVIHRSFDTMQTIRSWTGMWVLFNGVFSYYQTQKKRYLLLILSTPFFHLMYGVIVIPAILAIVFKSLPRYIFIGLYIISFIVSVDTLAIVDVTSHNDFTRRKFRDYYRIEGSGEAFDPIAEGLKDSNAVWYAKYGRTTAVYAGSTAFIVLLLIGGFYKKSVMNNVEYGLMTTALLMASTANFLSFAFAFYSRTMANASTYVLAVVVLLMLRGEFEKKSVFNWKKIGLWVGVCIFIPKIVFFSSDFLYKTSMMVLAMPFLNFFSTDFNASIRDFINILLNLK